MTMQTARRRLALLWLIAAGVLTLLLVALSFRGLEGHLAPVWGWFLPTVLPILTLILATFGLTVRGELPATLRAERVIDVFLYRLAAGLSAFYLGLVLVAIAGWQLSTEEDPVPVLNTANLWLGPLQGLAASAVGWFFLSDGTSKAEGDEKPSGDPP